MAWWNTPGTTDIKGAAFGNPTPAELQAAARIQAAREEAAARTEAARLSATTSENNARLNAPGAFSYTGVPGQFRRQPQEKGVEAQAFTRASLAGKELGDETSYGGQGPLYPEEIAQGEARVAGGQQDFAKPLQVTRGMTGTYQGPVSGTEYATEGQAAQAFRRNQGADFVPAGGAMETLKGQNRLAEINAQGKSQEALMAGDMMTRKRNLEAFMNRVQSDPRFYKEGPEGMTPVNPGLGQLLLGFKTMGESDPEKAFQSFETRATRHLDETKWVNDQGVVKAVGNLISAGYTLTPGQKAWLSTQQANPDEEKKRRDTILQWVNPATIPGGNPEASNREPSLVGPGLSVEGPLYARPGQPLSVEGLSRQGNSPLRPFSVPPGMGLLRPDQMGNLIENHQKEEARKNQLAKLSADFAERMGLGGVRYDEPFSGR